MRPTIRQAVAEQVAGVPLGLPVYHILEEEIKESMDPDLYQEHVGLMELSADVEEIVKWVKFYRHRAAEA